MFVPHLARPPAPVDAENELPGAGTAAGAESEVDLKEPVEEEEQRPAEADVDALPADAFDTASGEEDAAAPAAESPESLPLEETDEVKADEAVAAPVVAVTEPAIVVPFASDETAAATAAGETIAKCWLAMTSCLCMLSWEGNGDGVGVEYFQTTHETV